MCRRNLRQGRHTEYDALREHEKNWANAKERVGEERTSMMDMFAGHQAKVQEETIDEIVEEQMEMASADLMATIAKHGPLPFSSVLVALLQAYTLRETNLKDICVNLDKAAKIDNSWGAVAIENRAMKL